MALSGPPPGKPYFPASTPFNEEPFCDFDDDINVIVGREPNGVLFEASESLLRHYSGYFNTLLAGMDFVNATRAPVRLPGEQPEIFAMAHSFLRRRVWFEELPPGAEQHNCMSWDTIIELWTFGERRQMPLIQNAASDLFAVKVKKDKQLPDRFAIEFLWERTKSKSPLRHLLIDLVRPMWLPDKSMYYNKLWNTITSENGDVEPLIANMHELVETDHNIRISERTQRQIQMCTYHVHEDFVNCEGSEEARLPDGQQEWHEIWVELRRREGWIVIRIRSGKILLL